MYNFRDRYIQILRTCIQDCGTAIHNHFKEALNSCYKRWNLQTDDQKKREVISPNNLQWSKRRAEAVFKIILAQPLYWVGQRYRALIILQPAPSWTDDTPLYDSLF